VVEVGASVSAALVALAFGLSTLERWLVRRRPHELAWTVALAMFLVASAALATGAEAGWTGASFRVFYLFGAVLNVPVLALGTVFLLARPATARRWALAVAVAGGFAAGVLATSPFTHRLPRHRLPQASEVFGPLPRVLAGLGSGAGAVVLVGGAAWSAWRALGGRGPRGASPRRLALGNALVAAGTLVSGASGLLNSAVGQMTGFAVALVVGIAVIFAGFLAIAAGQAPTVEELKRPQ
jgi:hypothetical protein